MKKQYLGVFCAALFSTSVNAAVITDTLENIGLDGTPVNGRVIGNVTVTISNQLNVDMTARTYFDNSPKAFGGAGRTPNAPISPGNVSGSRFISTVESPGLNFDTTQPIIFSFSSPVLGFGLTTIDLLESGEASNLAITLDALDLNGQSVASQSRTGPQGSSGLDLDWFVSSGQPVISEVRFSANNFVSGSGYGIDDLVVQTVPLPATAWLFGSGLLGLIGFSKRKKS